MIEYETSLPTQTRQICHCTKYVLNGTIRQRATRWGQAKPGHGWQGEAPITCSPWWMFASTSFIHRQFSHSGGCSAVVLGLRHCTINFSTLTASSWSSLCTPDTIAHTLCFAASATLQRQRSQGLVATLSRLPLDVLLLGLCTLLQMFYLSDRTQWRVGIRLCTIATACRSWTAWVAEFASENSE